MNPRDVPTTGAGIPAAADAANLDPADADGRAVTDAMAESETAEQPNQAPAGQSSGADTLTLSLFGAMVIIASVCLVIW